ncbi:MAG: TRAP transporter large permease [Alphaproteobacteria bacterium]|nr:TRAP transporter large permease [Alphaproteobacteria bacterium]
MLWLVLGSSLLGFAAFGAALGATMGLTGFIILKYFANGATQVGVFAVWDLMNNFTFSAVPMFILLGDLLVASGLSNRIYSAISPLFERVPGQLLHSNVAVSTVFGAISGSSAATSAAVGSVAYPELGRRGYYMPAVAASLAAGGTLGLLIPPSLSLLIYGAWQEVSIGKLFLAGVIPGLMMAALFMAYIWIDSYRRPQHLPARGEPMPIGRLLRGLVDLWPVVILIGSVLGTMYAGLATATEAAGMGVAATVVMGFAVGDLTWKRLFRATVESAVSFGALSFILVGAAVLSQSITVLGVPKEIVAWAEAMSLSKYEILFFVVIFYLIMGIFFDGISLMLTTVPFIFPVMTHAGFDPVWLGVFVTIMIEIGMLTPPVGVNLFVMMAIARGAITMKELGRECLPYWLMLLLGTALMTVWPDIATWLPRVVIGAG